jgi:hypothetical protein
VIVTVTPDAGLPSSPVTVTFTDPIGWVVGWDAGASCATAVAAWNKKAIAVTATAGTNHRIRPLMFGPPKNTDALPIARGEGLANPYTAGAQKCGDRDSRIPPFSGPIILFAPFHPSISSKRLPAMGLAPNRPFTVHKSPTYLPPILNR